MSATNDTPGVDASGLRERLPQQPDAPQKAESVETAQEAVRALNDNEAKEGKDEKDKRTFGRTLDGTVFTVPHTEDMVSQLFDPTQPKNASDIAIVTVLVYLCLLLYFLPQTWKVPVFAVTFLFWRTCYNAGIGWLLHNQSHHKRLVVWAKKSHIFEKPETGKNPYPFLYQILKQEMEAKIPKDYKFEDAPIEYNTWLVFRRVVDLILMCDFTSYCLFAIACGGRPVNEKLPMTIARWVGGWLLVAFNLWVKLDAHRVVKDFAWYWGDFFFLIDQELTFDGVFELAPHPMYSVGYAGFYGISMMAASYKVLFISIIAHAAQLTFLALVESPHIERTYNTPPPPKRVDGTPEETASFDEVGEQLDDAQRPSYKTRLMSVGDSNTSQPPQPSNVHHLIGLQNIDLHRVTDVSVIVLQAYMYTLAFFTPSTRPWQSFFVISAVVWRLWYSIGIGFILDRQSNKKRWTRHFLKYGESTEEAWRQWKGIYHISMVMCYTSFICAAWKMYGLPEDWTIGMAILRHVVGSALIALQIWTVSSIYESLGEFGWFFGDFFFDQAPKLTYSGIYRFLNNPERTIGLAGVWGAAIITWSKATFLLALLSHGLTLCFIQFVERPHMQKLYRMSLRETSGVSRSIKRSLPSPLQKWTGSVDKALDDGLDFLEDMLDAASPKLAEGFSHFVTDSRSLFKQFPARISITRIAPDLAGYDPKDYSLEIDTSQPGIAFGEAAASDREGKVGRSPQEHQDGFRRVTVQYGAPIRVKWTAPLNHGKKDWIGLFSVGDNASREVTKVSSQGRWIATNKGAWDYSNADDGILVSEQQVSGKKRTDGETEDYMSGELVFSGDKLWWTQGIFEFRYHHDGKYNVMAISLPFEIRLARFDDEHIDYSADRTVRATLEQTLLPVLQNCFDRNPDVAPRTADEAFGPTLEREGKYAKRVVYAVQQMFGIEFAAEVVQSDGSVKNLAWRVCNAKKVLAPYSMSSKGPATPD
ncbi:Phosphatidylethanolamine N-methyltransferase [Friedmanniomyces simplex]|uniref:Phosphatidylethanolamine N-methyltransferase n=1 Tax=Friedmanniomyces simplex TaxID=329884 RepID=A0A4U0XZ82_9PEZI|nr:Phosphatidylethanolamine N-methyltransferase [Friedmanniomyces simplex]